MISPYVYPELAAQKRCKGIMPKPQYGAVIEYIETLVCSHFGQTVEAVKKRGQKRPQVICRQVCFHLLRINTPLSLMEIGARFGKDHTTVVHGIQVLRGLMFSDEKLRADVQLLEAKIDERN